MRETQSVFLNALERSRLELLDLSFRNPLLKFRLSTKRGLSVIDENSDQIFDVLVREKASLKFHHTLEGGAPKKKRSRKAVEDSPALDIHQVHSPLVQVGMGEDNRDDSIATPYSQEEMEARLLATWHDAELIIQERGANFLNISIGHLEWYEADASEILIRSPIILVPIKLERKGAKSRFIVKATDEDPSLNIALVEKLKEFNLVLPPLPDNVDEVGVTGYLTEIAKVIKDKQRWNVDTHSMALGFFSFGKFLMYRDLDPENWPEWRDPASHEILTGILTDGLAPSSPAIGPYESLDEKRPGGEIMEVVDCDGSQAEALAEVAHGNSLIVQGPPGTGKSQTITNMIAQAVHAGKTVLFIAEKMAALDVVKRRLDNIGLGDICLELHSDKANKKAVIEQLKATMDSGKPILPQGEPLSQLRSNRDALNRYSAELHAPVGNSGLSPFQAISKTEAIRSLHPNLPLFAQARLSEYDQGQYQDLVHIGEDLERALQGKIGVPAQHPFAGIRLTHLLPGQELSIKDVLEQAKQARQLAEDSVNSLALVLELPAPENIQKAMEVESLAELLAFSPNLAGLPSISNHWEEPTYSQMAKVLTAGVNHHNIRSKWDARVRPKAWGTNLTDAREDVALYAKKWWRILSGKYRQAANLIKAHARNPIPKGPVALMEFAEVLIQEAELHAMVEAHGDLGKMFFGSQWQGIDSPWAKLDLIAQWAKKFRTTLREQAWPESLASLAIRQPPVSLTELKSDSSRQLAAWKTASSHLSEAIRLAEEVLKKMEAFSPAAQHLDKWATHLDRLPEFAYCHRLLESLRSLGFEELADLVYHGRLPSHAIFAALEWNFGTAIVGKALAERNELRDFQVEAHSANRDRFRKGDQNVFLVNRAKMALKHWEDLPAASGFGQIGYLQEEFNRKRQRPIRKLMENAAQAVQAIKPVFMMSPLSIASYLPTTGPHFDLAIFDEASQVKPVDAFGAILRAKQVVVVGDDKQMPPTAFFDRMADQVELDDDSNEPALLDVESILGMCKARGMRDKMLKWHYRSQHESLIAVSNQEFYRDLVVFPSPHRSQEGLGLKFHYFPDTVYERGTSRTNPLEADEVAKAVLEHARKYPSSTLGVVAFSMGQKSVIEAKVEALARENPELDAFISNAHPDERFFIKNLENVQGDERDTIFISIGYGRDKDRKPSVSFGPVNLQGGERRLNVLISRARKSCHVFTNIKGEDIDLSRTASEGVRVLRNFLAYAETGKMDLKSNTGREPDSDFEVQVMKVIEGLGYRVQPQVGCGTYRVDIGVLDAKVPGRYLAGIECDGATYHSARWARDRDRLREDWLRKQGWNIIRIWSTDWYRQRNQAIEKLRQQLEAAGEGAGSVATNSEPRHFVRDSNAQKKEAGGFPKYRLATLPKTRIEDLENLSPATLMEWIKLIVEVQFPVHRDEIVRRVVDHLGQRVTETRTEKISTLLAGLSPKEKIMADGDHYLIAGERVVAPRDRSEYKEFRQIEYVHHSEVKAAIHWVVRSSFGCQQEEAKNQVVRLLGVVRGAEASERVEAVLAQLVTTKELISTSGVLRQV